MKKEGGTPRLVPLYFFSGRLNAKTVVAQPLAAIEMN